MLVTQALTYQYTGEVPLVFPDLRCATGEQWLLLGQSGSGKTTLLHLLAGLLTPRTGAIHIADTEMTALSERARDRFRGQHIGIVFQQAHFVRSLTVLENLTLAQQLAGRPADSRAGLALLDALGIAAKASKSVNQLSVGEQQRVNIARAVINHPPLLLADEPTSALDDHNTQRVVDLLQTMAARVNATLLIVTHDQRLANVFAQKIVLAGNTLVG